MIGVDVIERCSIPPIIRRDQHDVLLNSKAFRSPGLSAQLVRWLGRRSATCAGCHSRTVSRRGIWQTTLRCVPAAFQSCLASHHACLFAAKIFSCQAQGVHLHSKLLICSKRNAAAIPASLQEL